MKKVELLSVAKPDVKEDALYFKQLGETVMSCCFEHPNRVLHLRGAALQTHNSSNNLVASFQEKFTLFLIYASRNYK